MKKILHKLTYAQNPSQYEAHPSYYEEILCKALTVQLPVSQGKNWLVVAIKTQLPQPNVIVYMWSTNTFVAATEVFVVVIEFDHLPSRVYQSTTTLRLRQSKIPIPTANDANSDCRNKSSFIRVPFCLITQRKTEILISMSTQIKMPLRLYT